VIRLGPLRPNDRAQLAGLLVATGAFNSAEVEIALALFDVTMQGGHGEEHAGAEDALRDYELLGAYESERLAGYVCFGPTPATEGTFDLYWLAVHPESQRGGVGSALVNAVEETLAARGARLLVVETSSRPDYARTRAFYARSGYVESARVRDFYAPADDRIMLTTRLTHTRLTTRARGAATR